ncbi:MAG TPA: Gfo/Idh/MocA family oxidoreductase [Acidimicrobiia bacterium]|nr:Gfo/Idh/MocA family oxidoreductase [Acidimicrobiia bacterium]
MTERPEPMIGMGKIGIGMIGCGMIGQIHADGIAKLVDDGVARAVVGADPSPDARAGAQRNAGFERMTDDPHEVIEDPEVDAVMICSPTRTHPELVRAVVEAGKPMLCEKPLATTFDAVREMCDAVEASGLVAQVGFHSRFHPLVREVKAIVDDGRMGRVIAYTVRDDQYWPTGDVVPGHSSWRSQREHSGGGALLEHSIHAADVCNWLFGRPTEVFAKQRSLFGYDVEDAAALTIDHESGVIGNLVTVFHGGRGREERRIEVFLEGGAVELTHDFVVGASEDSFLVHAADAPPERIDPAALRAAHFAAMGVDRPDVFFYLYVADRAWVESVRAGVPAHPGVADAFEAHLLVEGAYRSADQDRPVALDGLRRGN